MGEEIRTIFWQDSAVVMIDQRALPVVERYVTCTDYRQVVAAINDLTIRGAPAIGIAAAMGIALGVLRIEAPAPELFRSAFAEICYQFSATRPTARNLFWAIERMRRCFDSVMPAGSGMPVSSSLGSGSGRTPSEVSWRRFPSSESGSAGEKTGGLFPERAEKMLSFSQGGGSDAAGGRHTAGTGGEAASPGTPSGAPAGDRSGGTGEGDPWRQVREALIVEAVRIGAEDVAINRRIGENGRELIPAGARILTHCNAGALATAGYGTALGVIRAACETGKNIHVYVDETRPVLQGARLTAWELKREGIPCTLIADNMAAFLMRQGKIDLVITGADRIAGNGDAANKIGTYGLAVLAKAHGIPFYVAAPLSTIDAALPEGGAIPIEERPPEELTHVHGVRTAPEGISVWNPAFDVTPHELISAIITEAGVLRPPFADRILMLEGERSFT